MWYLYLWLMGAPTDAPETPEQYKDQATCEAALDIAVKMNKRLNKTGRKFAGICLPEDSHLRIQLEWDDDAP